MHCCLQKLLPRDVSPPHFGVAAKERILKRLNATLNLYFVKKVGSTLIQQPAPKNDITAENVTENLLITDQDASHLLVIQPKALKETYIGA